MIKLFEHQEKGKQLLLENNRFCLFFEVGAGKTYTALSALCELPPGRVLIVAPKKVLQNVWIPENHYDLSKHEVTYINYEKVARDPNFTKQRYDYIILDEVHRLKGKTTKTSRKFKVVTAYAKYVWGLTGTPQANNYADVYNIYKHMNILEFNMSYDEFVQKYYYIKQMIGNYGYAFYILLNPKKESLGELMERIGEHCMVKKLKDCIDLPEKRIETYYVDGMNTKDYRRLKHGVFSFPDLFNGEERTMIPLESINKAHQAANGFVYVDSNRTAKQLGENFKFLELKSYLEDMLEETERVIIVYYFQYDLELLKTLEYAWTTDPKEFPYAQILFMQYNQGEGLNLQYCNHMIFYSYDYSFLSFEQMCGRIYRPGQKNTVIYTIFIAKNTIEETIWKAISEKKSRDEYLKEALRDE
ncbi:MAG: DEAD/DEAH box helicase [Bacteroidales bacterium]|jgi:SNF2 family DNA or RNA helicase|nr:DEAD/DEAH box helicase [Bacteroidales bacterium]